MLSAVSSEKVIHLIIVFIFVHKFHLSDTQIEREAMLTKLNPNSIQEL